MTKLFTELVPEEFSEERASGASVKEAVARVAARHGRNEDQIRSILVNAGAMRSPFKTYATATGVVAVAAFGFWAASPKSRPVETELVSADYKQTCTGDNRFEAACKGKFVRWTGTVASLGDDYVRTRLNADLTVDVQGVETNKQILIKGQKVIISGWLTKENLIYPDVTSGVVDALETVDQAKAREEQEAAQKDSELATFNQRLDRELDHCKMLDPAFGTGDQTGVRECLRQRMR